MIAATVLLAVLGQSPPSPAPAAAPPTLTAPTPLAADAVAAASPDMCRQYVNTLASFGTRHTLSTTTEDTRGIGGARRWLHNQFLSFSAASGDRLDARNEEFHAPTSERIPNGAALVNVLAVLPGTMPEASHRRYYVVGHYDTINADRMDPVHDAPGANDDASGTAVVLECARVLSTRTLDATIVFLCTAGEEQGLVGAKYHAESAAGRGEHIFAVLNNDIVGDPSPASGGAPGVASDRFGPATVRVFSEGLPRNPSAETLARIRAQAAESDSPSRQLARFVADVAEREHLVLRPTLVFRPDRFLRGGDHSAFNDAGFPAVRFTVPAEDYSRQHANVTERDGKPYGDVPAFVDATYLANVARLNIAALIHLANAPSPPANVRIITKDLTTTTTIMWDPSPEPDTAGYEIVTRETTAATWQQVIDAGTDTSRTLPISKDNFFFGVRAYDRDGYRSPVGFAWAARE